MEQRRLRLGDILDDYCPRERRVTNHAVVAMIEEDVKQTRCTTCDAEHVYKGGKAPRRKKADTTKTLYKEVLAGLTDQEVAPVLANPAEPSDLPQVGDVTGAVEIDDEDSENLAQPEQYAERDAMDDPADPADPADASGPADPADDDMAPGTAPDEGPVHRQLIRAQLPRVEGVKVERQAPEFTIRNNPRGGQFRGDSRAQHGRPGGGGSNVNGARFGRGPQRPAGGGGRGGTNQGFGRGPGGGNQPRHGGGNGPRKRGR